MSNSLNRHVTADRRISFASDDGSESVDGTEGRDITTPVLKRIPSLHAPKASSRTNALPPELKRKNSRFQAKRRASKLASSARVTSPPALDMQLEKERLAQLERERVEFEDDKRRFSTRTEQRRKLFAPTTTPAAVITHFRDIKSRGKARLLDALSKSDRSSSGAVARAVTVATGEGSSELLWQEDDDALSACASADHYSMSFAQPAFEHILRKDKEFNSDLKIRGPFVASTYRRVAQWDEGWFSHQTGAENPANRPESAAANYSTNIAMSSFQSIGSDSFSQGVDKDEEINSEGGERGGSEEGEGESKGAGVSRHNTVSTEDFMFLDRMETAMFSFVNGRMEDSVTQYDSDEGSSCMYDGLPRDENYFGEEARSRFFALYHRLGRKGMLAAPAPQHPVHPSSAPRSPLPSRANLGALKTPPGHKSARGVLAFAHLDDDEDDDKEEEEGEEGEEGGVGLHPAGRGGGLAEEDVQLQLDLEELQLDYQDQDQGSRPLSPRHRFLMALIADNKVPPLPIIIRHHHLNEELNLAHRALGDDYIIYLSAVVDDLPSLTKLNLRDNRLTDRGMGVFIHALAGQQRIVDIDISENKIDSASADALTHYLKDPHCKLARLRMANADLDDNEIAIFMNALQANESIVEMDVSHNLLGGRGEQNTGTLKTHELQLTGGASVAAALKHNNTLLTLNLSWNKLGLASSKHLGQALAVNDTLTNINLAYNSIRDEGAEAIGSSLALNTALRVLTLASNGIGPQGTIVLATGLRLCKGLERLDISGNPIGRQGVQSLLQTLNYHSVHRTFNLSDCVFDDSGPKTAVDLEFPNGKYSLDLSKPSNRCLVAELHLLASTKRGVKFKSIDYKAPGKNAKKVAVKLVRPGNPSQLMGAPYAPHRGDSFRPRHPYTLLEAAEWMQVVAQLHLVEETTGAAWEVPQEGILMVDCSYCPHVSSPIECLNATGLSRLLEIIQDHPKQYSQILSQCQSVVMETYQLHEMLSTFSDVGHAKKRGEMLTNLLGCCCDSSNVSALLHMHLPKIESLKDVQLQMRSMFFLCTNAITGHYCLDLENMMDRRAAIGLMAISAYENASIKASMPWSPSHMFTSQQGHRTNFRNETYRNLPIEGGVDASFFSQGLKDKVHGVLEFDFVSISRPDEQCLAEGNCNLELALDSRGLLFPLTALSSVVMRSRRKAVHSGLLSPPSDSPRPVHPHPNALAAQASAASLLSHSHSISFSAELQDAQSLLAVGIEPPEPLEEVLGTHVQSESSRITTRGELPCPVVEFHQWAARAPHKCLEGMKMEDLTLLNAQLNLDNAMFFDGKQMEKYVINIAIRIQSAGLDRFLEPTALLLRLAENGKYGFSGQIKNDDSKLSISDILTVDPYLDTVKFDIGLLVNPNAKHMKPTHKKYILHDDVMVMGSEIFVEVRCADWSMAGVAGRAREVVASFFLMLGIIETHVRLMSHKIVETKTSQFPPSAGTFTSCSSRVVVHQIDVCVDGLPDHEDVLIKTSSKAKVAYNNIVWKWRSRTLRDRGNAKIDLNLSCLEYWGMKTLHLRTLLGGLWVTCSQAAFIASRFPQFGTEGQPLRESVIVFLFSRVVDLENFREVVATLPPSNHCGVYRRVGWLNAINPQEVDFLFNLDLSRGDERLMAATLAKFAAVEPGDNMIEPRHRRSFEDIFIFGWDVPASWCVDPDKAKAGDGVPRRGQLLTEYCSAAARGCKKVPWVRDEYQDRFFLLAVPRAPWDQDCYESAKEENKWEI